MVPGAFLPSRSRQHVFKVRTKSRRRRCRVLPSLRPLAALVLSSVFLLCRVSNSRPSPPSSLFFASPVSALVHFLLPRLTVCQEPWFDHIHTFRMPQCSFEKRARGRPPDLSSAHCFPLPFPSWLVAAVSPDTVSFTGHAWRC